MTRLSLLTALAFAWACGPGADVVQQGAATASVSGDVFIRTEAGDTKQGTGLQVHLAPYSDSLAALLAILCATEDSIRFRGISDSHALISRAQSSRESANSHLDQRNFFQAESASNAARAYSRRAQEALERAEVRADGIHAHVVALLTDSTPGARSVSTGVGARFGFTGLQPGRYLLFTEWLIADTRLEWFVPITLQPRDSLLLDLDNAVVSKSSCDFRDNP